MDATKRMDAISAEGVAVHIENLFQSTYQNIVTALGGEDKVEPFHLAEIRGSLTRARVAALKPIQEIINGQKAAERSRRAALQPERSGSDGGSFRV